MAVALVTAGPPVTDAVGVADAVGGGVAVGVAVATRLANGVATIEACGVQDAKGPEGIAMDGETVGGLDFAGVGVAATGVGVAAGVGVSAPAGRGVSRSMDTV
jgi:hypothetical protein